MGIGSLLTAQADDPRRPHGLDNFNRMKITKDDLPEKGRAEPVEIAVHFAVDLQRQG